MNRSSFFAKYLSLLLVAAITLAPMAQASAEVGTNSFKLLSSTTTATTAVGSTNSIPTQNLVAMGCAVLVIGAVVYWGLKKMCKKLLPPPPPPVTNPPPVIVGGSSLRMASLSTGTTTTVNQSTSLTSAFTMPSNFEAGDSNADFILPSDNSFWMALRNKKPNGEWGIAIYVQAQWNESQSIHAKVYNAAHEVIREQDHQIQFDGKVNLDLLDLVGFNPSIGTSGFIDIRMGTGWLSL